MLGNLYQVPDKWWGFEAFGRENHPGVCVSMASAHKVNMLKGTDPRSKSYSLVHIEVMPDSQNNLLKKTSFAVKPYPTSANKVRLLNGDRFIGELDIDQLAEMQTALERYFLDEGR